MQPTRDNLLNLKDHLKTLDHAALLRGVRAAKHALTYRLDGYTGDDMLPLLLYEMHKVASVPIAPYPGLTVRQLSNDISTDKDYDAGLRDHQSQRAHNVFASGAVSLASPSEGWEETWECTTKDGYMCGCRKQKGKGGGGKGRGGKGGGGKGGGGKGGGGFFLSRGRKRGERQLTDAAGSSIGSSVGSSSPVAGGSAISGGVGSSSCPDGANLEDPAQLDRMLAARANADRDVVITILGPTSGTRAVVMDQEVGEAFVLNLLRTLAAHGVTNTLPITTHLHLPDHPQNNLCLSRLRPRGVCCAYSGVGMDLVHANGPGTKWTVTETHPYMLFLQRWWLVGQAVWRGYNVLSLDTDLHLHVNPLEMLKRPAYASFGAIMQLDSGWPVQGNAEGQAPTDERGQHVNIVPCRRASTAGSAADAAHVGCGCGVAPQPLLNTGFVYVRASGAAVPSLPQLIYNRSVAKILMRLGRTVNYDVKGKVDPHAVWAQDVVNEVAAELSSLPAGWTASCHRKDTSCRTRPLSALDQRDAKRRWWLPQATHSVWLASHRIASAGTCMAAAAPDKHLVAWTSLTHPQSGEVRHGGLGSGSGHKLHLDSFVTRDLPLPLPPLSALPSPSAPSRFSPSLAALPRSEVGRMCGMRLQVDPRWLTRARPLPCPTEASTGGVRGVLGQEVLHMQFTHADTRRAILEMLHWWRGPIPASSTPATASPPSQLTSCAALADGTAPSSSGKLSGAIVSSALASSTLLCLLPGPRDGQAVHIPPAGAGGCPCCWRVEELQKGIVASRETAVDAESAAAESKALGKARKYTGCRIWRRYL